MTSDGQHYTGGDYPVILPAGSTKESISIPIVDDDIVELDKTFFLTLVIPQPTQDTGVMRGDPYMATVTIINDDGECSVATLPLTYTHSSAARIYGCISSLLGRHAVKATLGLLPSLLRLLHIYAVITFRLSRACGLVTVWQCAERCL